MQRTEIKQIANYIKDLEEGLDEWDYRGLSMQLEFAGMIEQDILVSVS